MTQSTVPFPLNGSSGGATLSAPVAFTPSTNWTGANTASGSYWVTERGNQLFLSFVLRIEWDASPSAGGAIRVTIPGGYSVDETNFPFGDEFQRTVVGDATVLDFTNGYYDWNATYISGDDTTLAVSYGGGGGSSHHSNWTRSSPFTVADDDQLIMVVHDLPVAAP